MTEYVVLRKSSNGTWGDVKLVPSVRNARQAIQQVVNDNGVEVEGAVEFVAVPYRSWKPVKVSVETKTSLKFS